MSMSRVYLNGRFLPPGQAQLPVTDRGLLFGDSVYEVIPVYDGVPFRAAQHLARLQHSLDGIRLRNPMPDDDWMAVFRELCGDLPGQDLALYVQVTRGNYPQRAHRIPATAQPTVIVFASALAPGLRETALAGLKVVTLEDQRWQQCNLKTTNLLPNVLAQSEAIDQGKNDAILVRDGMAREGTSSNLFLVMEGLLITPPDEPGLLPGITRDLVLELAETADVPFARASVSETDLSQASEIWLTSSTREIAPVVELNGEPVGDGQPGAHWHYMNQLYQAAKQRSGLQAGERT